MKHAFVIFLLQDQDSGVEDEEAPAVDLDVPFSEGHVDTELDLAGTILLVYRPMQQKVELGEGCKKVESAVGNGITLGVNEVFKGKVKGQLQVCRPHLFSLSSSFVSVLSFLVIYCPQSATTKEIGE